MQYKVTPQPVTSAVEAHQHTGQPVTRRVHEEHAQAAALSGALRMIRRENIWPIG